MFKGFLRKSLVRYVVVGASSLAVDYTILLVLFHLFGVHVAVASVIAMICGLIVNFLLNKLWSFQAEGGAKQSAKQAVLYGTLVVINLTFTSWFASYMLTLHIGPEVSKLVSTATITLWNYILYKLLIFKAPEPIA
jgi:putative flippase GtrA